MSDVYRPEGCCQHIEYHDAESGTICAAIITIEPGCDLPGEVGFHLIDIPELGEGPAAVGPK